MKRAKLVFPEYVRVGSNEEQRSPGTLCSQETNPLKIEIILENLFEIVAYETLKSCRLVCRNWKKVSDPIFVERSVFVFENTNTKEIPLSMLGSPVEIQKLFRTMKQKVRFTAFKFQHDLLPGHVEKMYFNPNKSTMAHLEITNTRAKYLAWEPHPEYYNIDKWIGSNLKKVIASASENATALTISLEKLAGISHINLKKCNLMIVGTSGEVKMTPKELNLRQVDILNFVQIGINSVVDFSNLQVLHLENSDLKRHHNPLFFSDCANIKTLILINTTINLDGVISPLVLQLQKNVYYISGKKTTMESPFFINDYILEGAHLDKIILEDNCNGGMIFNFAYSISLDELRISNVSCMKTSNEGGKIKLKNLIIRRHIFQISKDSEKMNNYHYMDEVEVGVDISILPSSIESLEIERKGNIYPTFSSSATVCFPKLRQLRLSGNVRIYPVSKKGNDFDIFSKCPQLVDVSFFDYGGVIFSDNNDDDAFSALKRLVLWDVTKITLNKKSLHPKVINLDVLVLSSFIFRYTQYSIFPFEVFVKFRAKLVVFFKPGEIIDEETVTMLIRMKQALHLENVAFGPVKWETGKSFKESLVFSIVNTKAEYYLLEGDGGKAISRDQVMEMIPSNINKH